MKRKREVLEALVLARKSSGEADRYLTFLTREYGVLRVIAKGVRKMPSQRGGHLEPGTKVSAVVYHGPAGVYVGAVETIEYFADLHGSSEAVVAVQRVLTLLRGLFEELDQHALLYEMTEWFWREMPLVERERQLLMEVAVVLLLLRMAGLLPDLRSCQRCEKVLADEAVVYQETDQGWCCLSCAGTLQAARDSYVPELLKIMRFVCRNPHDVGRVRISPELSGNVWQATWHMTEAIMSQAHAGVLSR